MIRKVLTSSVLLTLLSVCSLHAQDLVCVESADTIASSHSLFENTQARCCSIGSRKKQKACFKRARNRIRVLKSVLSKDVVIPALRQIRNSQVTSCEVADVEYLQCSEEQSHTITEALDKIARSACNLQYTKDRQARLRKARRKVRQAKLYLGTEYVQEVRALIKSLLDSKMCGLGGEEKRNPCGKIVNPRDGAVTGNVYKLSDHSPHYPVFVTHNGTRSGTAINTDGGYLDTLTYTGLGNADPNGLRHHYRLNRSCSSLPAPYYLKLGSTCYEIDSPCSRID